MLLPALMLRSGPPVMGVAPPIAALSDFSSAGAGFFFEVSIVCVLFLDRSFSSIGGGGRAIETGKVGVNFCAAPRPRGL